MAAPKAFTDAYIECALWSSTGDDDEPLDRNHDVLSFDNETLGRISIDCDTFYAANYDAINCNDAPTSSEGHSSDAMAGHDFWLTRNGHGAGFWDGDWPEPQATTLTDAAHAMGEVNLYVGDDEKLYLA